LISLIPALSSAQMSGLSVGCLRTFIRTCLNTSDSSGTIADRLPTIPDGAGGLGALTWDVTGLLVLSGWAAGSLDPTGGEAELPAQVVTINNLPRDCG